MIVFAVFVSIMVKLFVHLLMVTVIEYSAGLGLWF